jgi:hypothetical protein
MRTMSSTLLERIEWVVRERKISARSWSLAAGQSGGYLGNLKTTLRRLKPGDPGPDPGAATLRRLAEVARVSETWLATGAGDPDIPAARPLRESPAWEQALAEARQQRDQERWPPSEYLDRAGDAVVPGREPSARLILTLAELLWRTDPERLGDDPGESRETGPPITQESPTHSEVNGGTEPHVKGSG